MTRLWMCGCRQEPVEHPTRPTCGLCGEEMYEVRRLVGPVVSLAGLDVFDALDELERLSVDHDLGGFGIAVPPRLGAAMFLTDLGRQG